MAETFVTRRNLRNGIGYWLKKKPKWPKDFHNEQYSEMAQERIDGLGLRWWGVTFARLSDWHALRGASALAIYRRGMIVLTELDTAYRAISEIRKRKARSLATCSWRDVGPLFELAASLKTLKRSSNVFPSKLCHFMAPTVFMVIDREVAGELSPNYECHWQQCKEAWVASDHKDELQTILKGAICRHGKTRTVFAQYPWATKILELCLIGKKAA